MGRLRFAALQRDAERAHLHAGGQLSVSRVHRWHLHSARLWLRRAAPAAHPLARSDGTTSMVILIGELMKQAERYIADGLHPRIIAEVIPGGQQRASLCSTWLMRAAVAAHPPVSRDVRHTAAWQTAFLRPRRHACDRQGAQAYGHHERLHP